MKQKIKKWAFRLTATCLLIAGLLVVIILNPMLTYANKTTHNNFTIFHNKAFDAALAARLDQASSLSKAGEFYDPKLKLDICLNDGSEYPGIVRAIRGQAFAWGFYNKVILQGTANFKDNYAELNGYRWNLTQLLAHEMTHCFQFEKMGVFKSKPFADIPVWKWEGYAEYISRKDNDQKDLFKNIKRFLASGKNSWAITFADGTIAPVEYYRYWIMVQYCIDIKKMTYSQILADTATEQKINQQMMDWYTRF